VRAPDHYAGLSDTWRSGIVYCRRASSASSPQAAVLCSSGGAATDTVQPMRARRATRADRLALLLGSEVTARLAVAIVQVSPDLLRPLPMNTPVIVQGARPCCAAHTVGAPLEPQEAAAALQLRLAPPVRTRWSLLYLRTQPGVVERTAPAPRGPPDARGPDHSRPGHQRAAGSAGRRAAPAQATLAARAARAPPFTKPTTPRARPVRAGGGDAGGRQPLPRRGAAAVRAAGRAALRARRRFPLPRAHAGRRAPGRLPARGRAVPGHHLLQARALLPAAGARARPPRPRRPGAAPCPPAAAPPRTRAPACRACARRADPRGRRHGRGSAGRAGSLVGPRVRAPRARLHDAARRLAPCAPWRAGAGSRPGRQRAGCRARSAGV